MLSGDVWIHEHVGSPADERRLEGDRRPFTVPQAVLNVGRLWPAGFVVPRAGRGIRHQHVLPIGCIPIKEQCALALSTPGRRGRSSALRQDFDRERARQIALALPPRRHILPGHGALHRDDAAVTELDFFTPGGVFRRRTACEKQCTRHNQDCSRERVHTTGPRWADSNAHGRHESPTPTTCYGSVPNTAVAAVVRDRQSMRLRTTTSAGARRSRAASISPCNFSRTHTSRCRTLHFRSPAPHRPARSRRNRYRRSWPRSASEPARWGSSGPPRCRRGCKARPRY